MATMTRLDRLAPVTLDELNANAALLTRVDRKYLLSRTDADLLVELAPSSARVLEIEGRREFGYASTYLDTDDLAFFVQSARRRRQRMKVRTRTYLDADATWLEVKTRTRGQTVKDRVPHPGWGDVLTDEGRELVVANSRSGGVTRLDVDALRPVLDTDYRRSTIYLPDAGTRVTLDVDLTWTSHLNRASHTVDGFVIVETKGGTRPGDFDRLLWSMGHRPLRISKYATGMAALHADLPGNRWHRVLNHI